MEDIKQKISKFNKTYMEMQKNLNAVIKLESSSQKITREKEIDLFLLQITKNMDLYSNMDTGLFQKVLCLYKIFGKNTVLNKKNKEIVWKYLNILHTISSNQKQQEIKAKEPFDMTRMSSLVTNLMNDESNGFKDIVSSISKKLENSFGDGDVNQAEVLKDLMSGKMESNGINFNEIIQTATKTLKEKIDKGEVNQENIKEIASQIKDNIQL